MTTRLSDVLAKLRPGAEWTLHGDSLDGLVWQDKVQSRPTDAEVKAALAEMPATPKTRTVADKLAMIGITPAELKAHLGLK